MTRRPDLALDLPDVRDGLTRLQRIILWQMSELQKERAGRTVPSALLYGRVVEHFDLSVEEFQQAIQSLVGTALPEDP
jgi:hypothetical protein